MVEKAGELAGCRILEPSAGTGNLIRAAVNNATGFDCCRIVAVEKNLSCVSILQQLRQSFLYANEENFQVVDGDFLEQNGNLGTFHKILMNPPFERGSDITHILHARKFLKPGGRLVAICANGPRQNETLKPLADSWEPLPEGTFSEQGTHVRTVMLTMSPEA